MNTANESHPPWYRQFWPWVIIAIPLLTVIASGVTFWLAVSNPETLVVDEVEYRQIRSELKAQDIHDKAGEESENDGDDGQP